MPIDKTSFEYCSDNGERCKTCKLKPKSIECEKSRKQLGTQCGALIPARKTVSKKSKKSENVKIVITFKNWDDVKVTGLNDLCYGQAKFLHELFGVVRQKLRD